MKTFPALTVTLAIVCLVSAFPRTPFAQAMPDGQAPKCFDGAAALEQIKQDGYRIGGLGFTDAGKSLIEVWVKSGGAFLLVKFDGRTGQLCIIGAGAGWQNYAGTQGGGT